VFDPRQADLVVMVNGRPEKDTISAFDGHDPKKCLLYISGKNGLQNEDAALAKTFVTSEAKTFGGRWRFRQRIFSNIQNLAALTHNPIPRAISKNTTDGPTVVSGLRTGCSNTATWGNQKLRA